MQLLTLIQRPLLLLTTLTIMLGLASCGNNPQIPQENPLQNPREDTTNTPNDKPSEGLPGTSTQSVTITYQRDTTDFTNPERGIVLNLISDSARPSPLSSWEIQLLKAQKSTVVHRFYNLSTFRNRPIDSSFLSHIKADLNVLRNNGMKAALRFSYSFLDGSNADAPLNIVLSHIDQLRPIFQENVDVIAFVDAGFIGRWGEWHSSTNGLTNENSKRQILTKLLASVPQSRTIAIRYAKDKKSFVGTTAAMTQSIAFNGSNRSRIAHHNDCFLSSNDDSGTYIWPVSSFDAQKTYLSQENLFLPQSGVTCGYKPPRTDCPTALAEMQRMRWSIFARAFDLTAVNRWQSQGCYTEISKRLGYRYRLIDAVLPQSHTRGTTMTVKVRMTNEGFAGIYNPRKLELVIRNRATGAVTRYNINPGMDVRLYLPQPGQTKTLTLRASIASSLPKGTYDLFLNLPDPATGLYNRPAYSIRLANLNMWEASTGFNKLGSFTLR